MTSRPPQNRDVIRVHPEDNVIVAINELSAGQHVKDGDVSLSLVNAVPAGHKIAICDLAKGSSVIKYGFNIGSTTSEVKAGEHLHSHNLITNLSGSEIYDYQPDTETNDDSTAKHMPTFDGFVRNDGRIGVRNDLWIVNTVGCVNQSATRIATLANQRYPDVADAFVALTHPFGCSQLGDDLNNTRQLLASLMTNPNAGGVIVIGLGCENNQLTNLIAASTGLDKERVRFFNAQEVDDEVEHGLACVGELIELMKTDVRSPQPASKLCLGMKCGGSDGFSGLTANAVVGRVADKLAELGGRVVLTETPEMFGAEQVLMNRADSRETFEKIVALVQSFKNYFIDNKQPIYENPSPGNKAGGLTTLEEKSLGAIQKGGKAIVNEVIDYGNKASQSQGLTLLEGPGNDAISSTALAAAGANMVLFTTGRGTPLGFPVPTVKISSNSRIASKKPHWIDFNAGQILDSNLSIDECAEKLFDYLLEVASGKLTNNEINECREISIWKNGVTL